MHINDSIFYANPLEDPTLRTTKLKHLSFTQSDLLLVFRRGTDQQTTYGVPLVDVAGYLTFHSSCS